MPSISSLVRMGRSVMGMRRQLACYWAVAVDAPDVPENLGIVLLLHEYIWHKVWSAPLLSQATMANDSALKHDEW